MIPMMRSHGINRHGTGINPHQAWRQNFRAIDLDYLKRYFSRWERSDYSSTYIVDKPDGLVARVYSRPDDVSEECFDCDDPAYAFCNEGYCEYHHGLYCDGDC